MSFIDFMMLGPSLLPVALAALSCVDALSLHRRDTPATVELPIERRQHAGGLKKRDSTLNLPLINYVCSRSRTMLFSTDET